VMIRPPARIASGTGVEPGPVSGLPPPTGPGNRGRCAGADLSGAIRPPLRRAEAAGGQIRDRGGEHGQQPAQPSGATPPARPFARLRRLRRRLCRGGSPGAFVLLVEDPAEAAFPAGARARHPELPDLAPVLPPVRPASTVWATSRRWGSVMLRSSHIV